MKAGKEKTKCLLDRAGKGSVKAYVQVQVKGIKHESSGGWKVPKTDSITQYHPDPVKHVREDKEKIPGECKNQCEANLIVAVLNAL